MAADVFGTKTNLLTLLTYQVIQNYKHVTKLQAYQEQTHHEYTQHFFFNFTVGIYFYFLFDSE